MTPKQMINHMAARGLRDAARAAEEEALKVDASTELGALGQAAGLEVARRLRWAANGQCPGGAVRRCKPLRTAGLRGYTPSRFTRVVDRLTGRMSGTQ